MKLKFFTYSFLILLLAFGWRAAHFSAIEGVQIYEELFLDSSYYALKAKRVATGEGFGDHPYRMSPLYPYFLSLFVDQAGELDAWLVRWTQAIVGALTALTSCYCAWILAGPAAGILAGVAVALYGPMIFFSGIVLVATLQAFFISLSLLFLLLYLRDLSVSEPRRPKAAIFLFPAGISLGLAAALRPTALVLALPTLLAIFLIHRLRRRGSVFMALLYMIFGILIVCAPFTYRNYKQSGEFILLSANGWYNFWIGNHQGATGFYLPPEEFDPARDPLGLDVILIRTGKEMSYAEASRWWRREAFREIGKDPLAWVKLLIDKSFYVFHPLEVAQLGVSFFFAKRDSWALRTPLLDARTVLLAALFCIVPLFMLVRRKDQIESELGELESRPFDALDPTLILVAWIYCLVYLGALALFFITARYRIPIMPVAFSLAAVTPVALLRLYAHRQRLAGHVSLFLILALFLLSLFLYDRKEAPYYLPAETGAEERQLASLLYRDGKYLDAVKLLDIALTKEDNPLTRGQLAGSLAAAGLYQDALKQYKIALKMAPTKGYLWFALGNLLRRDIGDPASAIMAYQQAIKYQVTLAEAHLNIGGAYLELGEREKARQAFNDFLKHTPKEDSYRYNKGLEALELLDQQQEIPAPPR